MKAFKGLGRVFLGTLILSVSVMTTGCGKAGSFRLFSDVGLKGYLEEGEAFAKVTAVMETGSVQMPSLELPILDPRHLETIVGMLAIRPQFGQPKADLEVTLNLTEVAKISGEGASLPNGNPLPVGGLDGSRVITLPVGGSSSRIYVALDTVFNDGSANKVAMVGVAVPFKELNGLGDYIGKSSFFLGFSFNKVKGLGGVFTGTDAGTSGIGLFVDMSSLVPATNVSRMALMASSELSETVSSRQINFVDVKPSKRKIKEIENTFYRLHVKKARIHLQ